MAYKAKVTMRANLAVAGHALKVYLCAKGGERWAPWVTTNEGIELEHKAAKGHLRLQGMQCSATQKDGILNKAAKNVRYGADRRLDLPVSNLSHFGFTSVQLESFWTNQCRTYVFLD